MFIPSDKCDEAIRQQRMRFWFPPISWE